MADKLTIGEQLDNYRRRYGPMLSARKISEPTVRALYWKQRMWEAQAELAGIAPRDYGPAELGWSDTYHQACEQWLNIGKTLYLHIARHEWRKEVA
jgi:hypothetical protein